MRGILIDPEAKTVIEIETEASLDALYALLGCDRIEAFYLPANHVLWLDEEGLYAEPPKRFFVLDGYAGQPFCGRGLILSSTPDGDLDSALLPAPFIAERIRWPDIEFDHMEMHTGTAHFMGVEMPSVEAVAVFKPKK